RLDADGREHHRRRHRRAEDARAEIARGDVAQHPRHDLEALERGEVRPHGALRARPAGHVAERLRAEYLARTLFELDWRKRQLRPLTREAPAIDLVLEV